MRRAAAGAVELWPCCHFRRSASATSFSLSDRLRAKAQEAQHAKRDESGDPSRVILAVLEGGGLNAVVSVLRLVFGYFGFKKIQEVDGTNPKHVFCCGECAIYS